MMVHVGIQDISKVWSELYVRFELRRFELVQPNPTHSFGFNPVLCPIISFKRVGFALRIQKQFKLGQVDLKTGSHSDSTKVVLEGCVSWPLGCYYYNNPGISSCNLLEQLNPIMYLINPIWTRFVLNSRNDLIVILYWGEKGRGGILS